SDDDVSISDESLPSLSRKRPAATRGLECLSDARAALARLLGSVELFALTGAKSDVSVLRREAALIATNLCEVTAAFVAIEATHGETHTAREAMAGERNAEGVSSSINVDAGARALLEQMCAAPVEAVESALGETSLALNKMTAAFMRVAGAVDLE